ncbi:subtilisin [Fusarium albosuccineum]|uniref:Subtilisin n=1 Tax=Fusarium albosuccineum TaxID=1237068 RepID=A0A8H4PKH2_9HYPO|nr:subtilisin [Fusarium albosuccineum]
MAQRKESHSQSQSQAKRNRNLSHQSSGVLSYHLEGMVGPEGNSDEDSEPDSDPDDARAQDQEAEAQDTTDNQREPTIEEDREALLEELGKSSWADLEAFKAAHGGRIKRCYMADKRDQNRTILHWLLSLKLLTNPVVEKNLIWLVETVVAYDSKIVAQITGDGQKVNCLHLAVQHKLRLELVGCLCQKSDPESLREAISQGNYYDQSCLHLAIALVPPNLSVIMQLLEKADCTVIAKKRRCLSQDDKPEDGNTVLHDFVHINRCFERGYLKTLKRLIQECPEALKISNSAKETPFQFHLATRDKRYPEWAGLEFSSKHDKPAEKGGAGGAKREAAAKVGRLLLSEVFSQATYEDACTCIYGEKHFNQAVSFQPAAPIDTRIDKSHPFLKFYPVLSYVELVLVEPEPTATNRDAAAQLTGFPNNDGDLVHSEWRRRTDSIRKVFSWFRRQKVRRILKLVVIDDGNSPCSDETIEECVREFDVRYLNWNKDDLCVEVLRKAGLSNVKELWLAWSGRNSVLYSWSCRDNGLPTLGKLETIHIHTKSGTESREADKRNLASFNFRLQDSIARLQMDGYRTGLTTKITQALQQDFIPLGLKLKDAMLTWTDGPNYAKLARVGADESPPMIEGTIEKLDARMMYHLKETKGFREIKVDDATHDDLSEDKTSRHRRHKAQKGHRWIDAARRLATAVNTDRLQNDQSVRPIKVALLDDGVTPGELSKPSALKDGWPLPSTRSRHISKPYYNSENGHGTKMARLIQMMCPFVSIYVAKVDIHKENDSSVAASAANAIEWAISKQVDIISMSWTIKRIKSGQGENQTAITALERAIQKAANNDILMFCAVQDSAHYGNDEIFPQKSDTKKLMIVGSADEDGDRSKFVNENCFDYLFPGEISIPGMLAETDKGSSVATAVAAGTAAMILWCAEYHSLTKKPHNDAESPATQSDHAPTIALATTLSVTMDIQGVSKTGPRTAAEWDFRQDKRMSALFDALKSAKDKFVDITSIINRALTNIDDIREADPESQKSCIEAFVTTCKGSLPLNLR